MTKFFDRTESLWRSFYRWAFPRAYWILYAWVAVWTVISCVLSLSRSGGEFEISVLVLVLVALPHRSHGRSAKLELLRPITMVLFAVVMAFPLTHFPLPVVIAGCMVRAAILVLTALYNARVERTLFSPGYFEYRDRKFSGQAE